MPARRAHSSSGLGHRPLTAAARVRIPYAPLLLPEETRSARRDPVRAPSPSLDSAAAGRPPWSLLAGCVPHQRLQRLSKSTDDNRVAAAAARLRRRCLASEGFRRDLDVEGCYNTLTVSSRARWVISSAVLLAAGLFAVYIEIVVRSVDCNDEADSTCSLSGHYALYVAVAGEALLVVMLIESLRSGGDQSFGLPLRYSHSFSRSVSLSGSGTGHADPWAVEVEQGPQRTTDVVGVNHGPKTELL